MVARLSPGFRPPQSGGPFIYVVLVRDRRFRPGTRLSQS